MQISIKLNKTDSILKKKPAFHSKWWQKKKTKKSKISMK